MFNNILPPLFIVVNTFFNKNTKKLVFFIGFRYTGYTLKERMWLCLKRKRQQDGDVVKIFAENMHALMDSREWTFRDLEEKTGIPNSSLNYYSKGTVVVPLPAAKTIADAFGLTVDIMIKKNADNIGQDA